MTRRKNSFSNARSAHRFTFEAVHEEAANLLRLVEDMCQRYPPGDELHFVRYLLRMLVLETEHGPGGGSE